MVSGMWPQPSPSHRRVRASCVPRAGSVAHGPHVMLQPAGLPGSLAPRQGWLGSEIPQRKCKPHPRQGWGAAAEVGILQPFGECSDSSMNVPFVWEESGKTWHRCSQPWAEWVLEPFTAVLSLNSLNLYF